MTEIQRAQAAKKQKSSQATTAKTTKAEQGLPFRGRFLPWQIESECVFGFLGLRDIAALFLASHGLQTAAVRHFKEKTTLMRCALEDLSTDAHSALNMYCTPVICIEVFLHLPPPAAQLTSRSPHVHLS